MNESTQRPRKASPSASEQNDGFQAEDAPAGSSGAADGGDPAAGLRPGEGETANGETLSASEQIARLKRECDEFRDQALRSRAEFANYQKRSKQQADADRAFAVSSLARDLLDPIDNLERAIEALRASGASGVTAGLDMVQRQLLDILAKHGVEPISAQGHPFDPNLHDAVLQQPSLDHPEGTVLAELSKGYRIRERVLRPSKVAVSAKPSSS
ncbi:MAG: nucleotide exchange factor GrpE [Isosphaerales bacterium]